MKYYLAVDIGASSGRHILAHMEGSRMVTEEIYRFPNANKMVTMADGKPHRVWDTDSLFASILEGMKQCRLLGKIPCSMGIDTWAVDYCLLNADDKPVGPCYAYRDSRTEGMDKVVSDRIRESDLYKRTGIQKQPFNTIYQLTADRVLEPARLEKARDLLMLPDYFNFLLTGKKMQEYTNATTTQLVSCQSGSWDTDLIRLLDLPTRLFKPLSRPGTPVGPLLPSIRDEVGYDLTVVLPATHDTGSAVAAVPYSPDEDTHSETLYISSGTWSLMGTELLQAQSSPKARAANFTNEGGIQGRFRFLKNIMGLWMIQEARKEFIAGAPDGDWSFGTICEKAKEASIDSIVPCNDPRFLAPSSMTEAIRKACRESGQAVPETPYQTARIIYRSLAKCYAQTLAEIRDITGKDYPSIHIIGGGCQADWLNQLTAQETGATVIKGPAEATAIGNLGVQMMADGIFTDLTQFRRTVYDSFDVQKC